MENYSEESPLLGLLPLLQRLISLTDVHKNFGLTKSQIIIVILLHNRRKMTMSEVAKSLSSSKEQATRAVSALVDLNLIERFEEPENRTHVFVRLSDFGKERLKKMFEELNKEITDRLNYSLSEEDILKLYESLKTVNEILNKVN